MLRGFTWAQHRCKAHIAALEQVTPVGAWLAGKCLGQQPAQFVPTFHIPLLGEARIILQAEFLQQQRVELWLHRAQRDVLVVGTAISRIEVRAIVNALAALLLEQAAPRQRHHQLHHVRRAIDDGGVDHRALAGLPGV
ncbi:hypothetical protein D3C81_1693140 [compost metagenome]